MNFFSYFMLLHTCLFKSRPNFSEGDIETHCVWWILLTFFLELTLICGTTQGLVLQTSKPQARDPSLSVLLVAPFLLLVGTWDTYSVLELGTHIFVFSCFFYVVINFSIETSRPSQNMGYVFTLFMYCICIMIRKCINTFILRNLTNTHARKPALKLEHMSSHGLLN